MEVLFAAAGEASADAIDLYSRLAQLPPPARTYRKYLGSSFTINRRRKANRIGQPQADRRSSTTHRRFGHRLAGICSWVRPAFYSQWRPMIRYVQRHGASFNKAIAVTPRFVIRDAHALTSDIVGTISDALANEARVP
jgi:hypothetical protein